MRKQRQIKNIIGKEFDKWLVINYGKINKHKKITWLCRCVCGAKREIVTNDLNSGKSKQCQKCNGRTIGKKLRKRYIGLKYGSLKVISLYKKSEGRETKKRIYLKCRCDCGNIVIRRSDRFTKLPEPQRCEKCGSYEELSSGYWSSIRGGAKSRNIDFNLNIKDTYDIFTLQNKKCILSGVNIVLHKNSKKRTASLDRIDSNFGYYKHNVQWVHKIINNCKWSLSDKEFIKICHLVSETHHNNDLDINQFKIKKDKT